MNLTRLVYVSAATRPFTSVELRQLLEKARAYNSRAEITGLLLYHQQSFFQILEGMDENLDELYERIDHDPRHHDVLLLSRQSVNERNFGEWSMGFVDVDDAAKKLPGFKRLLQAKSSFLDLHGDTHLTAKLVDGFQKGLWHQSVESGKK